MAKSAAIIDLDNCISDDHWRHHLMDLHLPKPNDRYWRYHDACHLDLLHNRDIIHRLSARHNLVIFTSRPEIVRGKTEQWLKKWNVPHDLLFMRPDSDHSPSVPLKRQMLLDWLPAEYRADYAIDDRIDVLDMYADEGVKICQHVAINLKENIHP